MIAAPVGNSEAIGKTVDLASFRVNGYSAGRSVVVRALWFFVGLPVLRANYNPFSGLKRRLLQVFGASIGSGAVIKPGVRIKNPWLLKAGRNCWFGEDCWIDNLAPVALGDNVCISQGAYLCTGNHDWSDPPSDTVSARSFWRAVAGWGRAPWSALASRWGAPRFSPPAAWHTVPSPRRKSTRVHRPTSQKRAT